MTTLRSQLLVFLILIALSGALAGSWHHRQKRNSLPFDREGATKASEAADMQKPGYEEFKSQVMGTLTYDLMKTDTFLVKAWRRGDYKVKDAVDVINKALARRAELKMDGITKEKFDSDMEKLDYKETEHDKNNRPILYIDGGKTSLRKELDAPAARRFEMHRAFMYTFQRSVERDLQNPEYPQHLLLVNYNGWTVTEGACPDCLNFIREISQDFETMFPGFVFRGALINTNMAFDVVFRCIKLALHKDNRDNLYSFVSESEWRPVLKKVIDEKVINKLVTAHRSYVDEWTQPYFG